MCVPGSKAMNWDFARDSRLPEDWEDVREQLELKFVWVNAKVQNRPLVLRTSSDLLFFFEVF